MNNKRHNKICVVCGGQYWANRSDAKYCTEKCRDYTYNHEKAKRMSNKLTPPQREVIIALQDYFIRDWKPYR